MPRFVIQEHHASHLHWDFRLEMDGILKSWTIPKEPSNKKGVKRLAIQTEDHDLDYVNFEGEIPKGQYGAGVVKIWDQGTYSIEERTENKIVFMLNGERLRGRFCLLRFRKARPKAWLFFKI